MSSDVRLSDALTLDPEKLATTRALIQASSGGGKSYLLRLIVEQCADAMPVIVIDPEGELHTMREVVSMILVGGGGEVPCTVASAGKVARSLLEHQASAIVDLSDLHHRHHAEYVASFVAALMSAPRRLWRKTLVCIDEAHRVCPEGAAVDSSDAVMDLMSRGRKRGYGGVLLTQRLSKLSKNAAAEAANQFVGYMNLDADVKRAADTLGITKAEAGELRKLAPGEWFGYGPALSERGVVRFNADEPQTTPPDGAQSAAPRVKHGAAVAQLAAAVAEAAEDTTPVSLEEAEQRVRELEVELRRVKAAAPPTAPSGMSDAEHERCVQAAVRAAVEKRDAEWSQRLAGVQMKVPRLVSSLRETVDGVEAVSSTLAGLAPAPLNGSAYVATPIPRREGRSETSQKETRPEVAIGGGGLTGPELRVLRSSDWWSSIGVAQPSRVQLAIVAGYHERTKSFTNALGSLRSKGFMEGDRMTCEGAQALGAPSHDPPTMAAFHEMIRGQLRGVVLRVFDAVLARGGRVGRAELAEALDYHERTKSFTNALGRLRTFGLIDYEQGDIVATGLVYPEALV